ncbi:MAG: hypothetical protein AAFO68_01795, partial [Pseudomonadota bacterium]
DAFGHVFLRLFHCFGCVHSFLCHGRDLLMQGFLRWPLGGATLNDSQVSSFFVHCNIFLVHRTK